MKEHFLEKYENVYNPRGRNQNLTDGSHFRTEHMAFPKISNKCRRAQFYDKFYVFKTLTYVAKFRKLAKLFIYTKKKILFLA